MKKHLSLSQILAIVVILIFTSNLLTGCEQNASAPPPSVTILKLKQPIYKNYILANYFSGGDSIILMRARRCEEPTGQAGYSPYWELPDGWLLVDWKWFSFPYNAGLALLTEQTWDKAEYRDGKQFPQKWPVSEPHILQPVEKIYYIKAEDLAKYANTKYPDMLVRLISGYGLEYGGVECSTDAGSTCFCEQSDLADSLWTIVQNDLSVAIKNGDLEHINDKKYNPY